eukprot:3095656-Karenia_brevis.AAC.1
MAYQDNMKQDDGNDARYECACPKKQQNVRCPAAIIPLAHKGQPDACNPLYLLHLALEMARQCQ